MIEPNDNQYLTGKQSERVEETEFWKPNQPEISGVVHDNLNNKEVINMENNETPNVLNTEVGTKDRVVNTVPEAKVKIASVVIQETKKNGEKMSTPLAQVMIKHPDKEELLTISKIKYIEGKDVLVKGLWVQLDADGKIQKSSAIDVLLKFTNSKTLEELYTKDIEAVHESEESKFLCLKAY